MAGKVTVIFGSPRKHGNTASLLKPFMEEMLCAGAEIDYYDVYEKKIAGCRACLGCQRDKTKVSCVIMDDMQPILNSLTESDLIVVAAPVYLWSAPAPVKAALDRTVYSSCKYYGDDPHGPALFKGKSVALITTCGYSVEKGTDLYEEMIRRYCKHVKMIYAGMLAGRQRNLKEPFMDAQKEESAREFARKLCRDMRDRESSAAAALLPQGSNVTG